MERPDKHSKKSPDESRYPAIPPQSAERRAQAEHHYKRIQDSDALSRLVALPFDPSHWQHWFTSYSDRRDKDACRAMRVLIGHQTIECCNKLAYKLPDGTRLPICASLDQVVQQAKATTRISFAGRHEWGPIEQHHTVIRVYERDCLEVALDLVSKAGLRPLVLNMASHKRPGGGWRNGAGAQEENLFRRTNYFQVLEDPQRLDANRRWRYPLDEFDVVYSPEVFVFRGSEAAGYPFLAQPVPLAFIACPAYTGPPLTGRPPRLTQKFAEGTLRKLKAVMQVAYDNAHDSLVLSAFGCGAYGNPPRHIAELMHEALTTDFAGCFRFVAIAIIEDHNSGRTHNPEGNVQPFMDVFVEEMKNTASLESLRPPAAKPPAQPAAPAAGPVQPKGAPTAKQARKQAAATPASAPPVAAPSSPAPPNATAPAPLVLRLDVTSSDSEAGSQEPLATPAAPAEQTKPAKQACHFWRPESRSGCRNGSSCRFLHPEP